MAARRIAAWRLRLQPGGSDSSLEAQIATWMFRLEPSGRGGLAACGALWQPVAPCGGLWRAVAGESWSLRGQGVWQLVAP